MNVSSLVMQPPWQEECNDESECWPGWCCLPFQVPAYLHLVDVGGMIPPPTVRHHSLAAAVRNHTLARLARADPLAVLPVLRAVAATAVKLQATDLSLGLWPAACTGDNHRHAP